MQPDPRVLYPDPGSSQLPEFPSPNLCNCIGKPSSIQPHKTPSINSMSWTHPQISDTPNKAMIVGIFTTGVSLQCETFVRWRHSHLEKKLEIAFPPMIDYFSYTITMFNSFKCAFWSLSIRWKLQNKNISLQLSWQWQQVLVQTSHLPCPRSCTLTAIDDLV